MKKKIIFIILLLILVGMFYISPYISHIFYLFGASSCRENVYIVPIGYFETSKQYEKTIFLKCPGIFEIRINNDDRILSNEDKNNAEDLSGQVDITGLGFKRKIPIDGVHLLYFSAYHGEEANYWSISIGEFIVPGNVLLNNNIMLSVYLEGELSENLKNSYLAIRRTGRP